MSSFLLVGFALNSYCYKLWQPNFRCFALNFVEAQDGMLLVLFLDENHGNTLMDFLRENLNTVMVERFIASSAPRRTQQIMMISGRWKSMYNIF